MEISVVIPAYNREKLVVAALESVLRQSCRPLETLVVDDASTDSTALVVEGFARAHPNSGVRLIRQSANAGVSAARNRGILEARAEWIAFLDSDDLWETWHLEKLAALSAHADVVFSRARGFSDGDDQASLKTWTSRFSTAEEVTREMIRACHVLPSASMVRRQTLMDVGMFDEDGAIQHAEDWDLWLRLIETGAVFVLSPQFTCLYRQHPGSACQQKSRLYRAVVRCLEKHRRFSMVGRIEWRKSIAYYHGKLLRACLEEGEGGAFRAAWFAWTATPWALRYLGGLGLCVSEILPVLRPLALRYARRFL